MNILIYLCLGIGLTMAAPIEDPVLMIDPTPPPGYKPGLLVLSEDKPEDFRKELRPLDDPRIMIDPTPPPGYRPNYESLKEISRELRPVIDPTKPGQYELPNEPGIMIDPTPPPGYTPNEWDIRTDPTINPKEIDMIDKDGEHDTGSFDPEYFRLHSGFADPEERQSE